MKGSIEIGTDGIIYAKMVGGDDVQEAKEWAEALKDLVREVNKRTGKKVKILTDLTEYKLGKSVEVRSIVASMEKENSPYVEKSAAYTPDFDLKNIANLVGNISGRKNFLVFKTKEEALKWLKATEKGKNKEDVIRETVHEVYGLLEESPDNTQHQILEYVGKLHNYSGMESDEEFELYTLQQGAVLVAYHYLKETPPMPEAKAVEYILANYSGLLDKYSSE